MKPNYTFQYKIFRVQVSKVNLPTFEDCAPEHTQLELFVVLTTPLDIFMKENSV